MIADTSKAGDGRLPWWGGWWVPGFPVVNHGLRVIDPSCIRLNLLKVNNLSKEPRVLSGVVPCFFGSLDQGKNSIEIYKSILCNELRFSEIGKLIARRLHLPP